MQSVASFHFQRLLGSAGHFSFAENVGELDMCKYVNPI